MALRFHLDESVHLAVAWGLRRRGIDVTIPHDTNLLTATDERHLSFAHGEQRVIITHDPDFLRLSSAGVRHSGIAFCHNQSRSVGEMIRNVEVLSISITPEEMIDRIVFL